MGGNGAYMSTPQVYPPGRPFAQEWMPDAEQHRRNIARVTNVAMKGQTNNSLQITLATGTTTTTVKDARISLGTAPLLIPVTADAATEFAAGSLYVVPSAGQCIIHHTNSATADRTFAMALIG